jgi:hypothetical protein
MSWILKESFRPFGHNLCIRNETSHTLFNKPESLLLRELRGGGLLMEVPLNICQKGHNLTLFFLELEIKDKVALPVLGHLKEAVFEAIAKVEKIELNNMNKETVFIDLSFTQYDQSEWMKIFNLYSTHQDEINKMLIKKDLEE